MSQAVANIFAGVNGAGKTTLYYNELELGKDLGYRINVNEIVSSFGDPKNAKDQVRASKIAIKMRENYIKYHKDFNQESTLCGKAILKLFEKLKEQDYQIKLLYVGLESPSLAKQRVKIRVAKGGHHVNDETIEKRDYESLRNLAKIAHLCDELIIFDNSTKFQKVLECKNRQIKIFLELEWIKDLGVLNTLKQIQQT
ncbi:ATPase [Campylobacter sp. MIT 99-7217]|nr:ATPase [Campylobacter sp. MIT 99-7217]